MAERRFPEQGGPSVPWRMIEPFDLQARRNHGQSLERLASRGGCDPGEVWCIVEARGLGEHRSRSGEQHMAWLLEWIKADEVGALRVEVERLGTESANRLAFLRHLRACDLSVVHDEIDRALERAGLVDDGLAATRAEFDDGTEDALT